MGSIEKKIEQWQKKGFISSEQSEKLKLYENQIKKDTSWILRGLLIAAVTAIGIGILSLIAANWHEIPSTLKLGVNFVWLIFLAGLIYKTCIHGANSNLLFLRNFNNNIQEALLFLFLISCMGSIGLISQIYHTGGAWYEGLFFWSIIMLPAVLISEGLLVTTFWSIVFAISSYPLLIKTDFMQAFPERTEVILIWPFACYLMSFLFRSFDFLESAKNLSKVFLRISFILFLIIIFSIDVRMAVGDLKYFIESHEILISLSVFSFLTIAIAFLKEEKTKRLLMYSYLIIPLLCFFAYLPYKKDILVAFVGGGCSIFIAALFALHFSYLKRRNFFNFFILIIGMRFLVFYFQALGGLAITGIGLILFGVLVLLLAFLFKKFKFYDYFEKKANRL